MLIIGNGRMITRDASKAFIENGAVAMDGNTIVMVGTTDEVKKAYPDGEFVDARGGVIMPAFINTHEHIYSSFARGLSIKGYNPKGFLDILDGQWWTIDRHLTLEQTRLSAMATYIDSIRNGVTTVLITMQALDILPVPSVLLSQQLRILVSVPAFAMKFPTVTAWTSPENL